MSDVMPDPSSTPPYEPVPFATRQIDLPDLERDPFPLLVEDLALAIGRFVTQFAWLEFYVDDALRRIVMSAGHLALDIALDGVSAGKALQTIVHICRSNALPDEVSGPIAHWAGRVEDLRRDRNRVVHGMMLEKTNMQSDAVLSEYRRAKPDVPYFAINASDVRRLSDVAALLSQQYPFTELLQAQQFSLAWNEAFRDRSMHGLDYGVELPSWARHQERRNESDGQNEPRPLGQYDGPYRLDDDFFDADVEIADLFHGVTNADDA